jgi:hypothetical protein
MNSVATRYTIAPAANPKPNGRNVSAHVMNANAMTAPLGWGRLEKTAAPTIRHLDRPSDRIGMAMAAPSGMLWIEIAIVINTASSGIENPRIGMPPSSPSLANETPTATPSGKLWIVRIPRMSDSASGGSPAIRSRGRGCTGGTADCSTAPTRWRTPSHQRPILAAGGRAKPAGSSPYCTPAPTQDSA